MAKTLANYDPLVQIPSGMTPAGADFPIVESHDILVGENDKRLDAKLDDIDSAIGNVGQTPIATQLSSKVNTGDIVTSVAATGSTSNNKIPSETAVRAAIEAKTINVDSTVTQGSTNAVSGGAVHTQLATKQDALTFDTTPIASSSNPVTSGGVKSALDTKQDALTFDTTPTASSNNPVTSGGVKAALDNKQNTLTYETTPIVGSVNPVTSTGIRNAIDTAAAQNLGAMQAAYDTFSANISARVSSLSNGMVACSDISAETTVGDTRILLYTGTTNANYTNGHWYYNSAPSNAAPSWTDGGAVGSAPTIDNTLTVEGAAANSKAVGDAIENIVTISNTQPGSNSGNKVWIKETTSEEVQIPTYAEHIAKANKADIATNNESDNGSGTISASKAYAIGDHFYINNTNTSSENYGVSTLYKTTAVIASGDAIVVGTNCGASKVADEITSLSNDIDTVKADLGESVSDLKSAFVKAETYDLKPYASQSISYIKADGSIVASGSWECFKFSADSIATITGVAVYGTSTAQVAIAFYNSEAVQNETTLISTVPFSTYSGASVFDGVSIPINTKVIAISSRKATNPNSIITGSLTNQFINLKTTVEGFNDEIDLNTERLNDISVLGKNLFDKNRITANAYLRTNGTVATDTTSYSVSDYMPVSASTVYTCNCLNVCYYAADKSFISFNNTDLPTFTTPATATYARITIANTAVNAGQFEKGGSATAYQAHGYYVPSERVIGSSAAGKTIKTVGQNGDFTKLTDGLKYCRANGNIRLIVDAGIYDIIEELGADYWTNYSGYTDSNDMNIGNDCEYIFTPNSYVQCAYTGNNSAVGKYFSPFNSLSSGHGNFVIDGLNLYVAGCRYAIHDDISGTTDFETHIYKNCNIQCSSRCIGAGFGKNMHVEILDSVFWNRGGTRSVAWHNCSTEGKNYLLVSGCYFYGTDNTLELVDYGSYTQKTEVIAHNNSVLAEIYHDVSATYPNILLRAWNNEVRT